MASTTAARRTWIWGGTAGALLLGGAVALSLSSGTDPPPEGPPPDEALPAEPAAGIGEQADLSGDFELLDPSTAATAGLEGVVPSLSDLPVPLTQRTMRYVEHFASTEKGRKAFSERYRRASKYRDHIERKLLDLGLPEDALWLVAVESGFNPQATSAAGAVGLFQFMPETAARFGLAMGPDIDERRSITKSTDAAIAYLTFLFEYTGRWDLALAAYNCGEGCVDDAVDRARQELGRGPDDEVAFHELAELGLLPRETAHFVPQIHAFAIVAHNRELLDLDDLDPLPPLRFAEVAVPPGTRLAVVAKAADVSISTLREYNPDLLTDRLPEGGGDVLVNIPSDSLAQALAALPAHLARDDDAGDAPDKPRVRAAKSAKGAALPSGAERDSSAAEKKRAKARATLVPAPLRPGTFVLPSGIFVEIDQEETSALEVRARVEVLDPTRARAPLGVSFKTEPRSASTDKIGEALSATHADLKRIVLGEAAQKLRAEITGRRKRAYDKTKFLEPFAALSDRAFPKGHPMHGALLVGPTEPADDMFLEPEPAWALDTTVTVRGKIDPDALAEPLERAFATTFVPARPAALAPASRTTLGTGERTILVGWPSPAITTEEEAAAHLAFVLACHNKLGRFHRALRHDRAVAGRVACSLEVSPQATVAWVLAMPALPYTTADAEKAIDGAVHALTDGPTSAELTAARGLLRAELARERDTATVRGLPKSRVTADAERILAAMQDADRASVTAASKALFAKDRKIVLLSD